MPVMGPSYNKDTANKTAEKMWEELLNKYKLLKMPEDYLLVKNENRTKLKEEFFAIIHKVYLLDCYEGF